MYKQYLKEKNMEHLLLSDSSLIRILNVCSAERRKSIQGIDTYSAEASYVKILFINLVKNLILRHSIQY
jgi:hypothetical protein